MTRYMVRVAVVVAIDRDAWAEHFGKRGTARIFEDTIRGEAEAGIRAALSPLIPEVVTVARSRA